MQSAHLASNRPLCPLHHPVCALFSPTTPPNRFLHFFSRRSCAWWGRLPVLRILHQPSPDLAPFTAQSEEDAGKHPTQRRRSAENQQSAIRKDSNRQQARQHVSRFPVPVSPDTGKCYQPPRLKPLFSYLPIHRPRQAGPVLPQRISSQHSEVIPQTS